MQILVCVPVGSAVTCMCASVQLDERVCEAWHADLNVNMFRVSEVRWPCRKW